MISHSIESSSEDADDDGSHDDRQEAYYDSNGGFSGWYGYASRSDPLCRGRREAVLFFFRVALT